VVRCPGPGGQVAPVRESRRRRARSTLLPPVRRARQACLTCHWPSLRGAASPPGSVTRSPRGLPERLLPTADGRPPTGPLRLARQQCSAPCSACSPSSRPRACCVLEDCTGRASPGLVTFLSGVHRSGRLSHLDRHLHRVTRSGRSWRAAAAAQRHLGRPRAAGSSAGRTDAARRSPGPRVTTSWPGRGNAYYARTARRLRPR